jgi:hypothetical protein
LSAQTRVARREASFPKRSTRFHEYRNNLIPCFVGVQTVVARGEASFAKRSKLPHSKCAALECASLLAPCFAAACCRAAESPISRCSSPHYAISSRLRIVRWAPAGCRASPRTQRAVLKPADSAASSSETTSDTNRISSADSAHASAIFR